MCGNKEQHSTTTTTTNVGHLPANISKHLAPLLDDDADELLHITAHLGTTDAAALLSDKALPLTLTVAISSQHGMGSQQLHHQIHQIQVRSLSVVLAESLLQGTLQSTFRLIWRDTLGGGCCQPDWVMRSKDMLIIIHTCMLGTAWPGMAGTAHIQAVHSACTPTTSNVNRSGESSMCLLHYCRRR